jgi:hypothetical protein
MRNVISMCTAIGLFALGAQSALAQGAPKLTEEQAHEIGVEAYVYLYPLVLMDITRKQLTNAESGKEIGKGPMNVFVNVPIYPPGDFKGVVRSNIDTLYSLAWLDLTKEPVIMSVPDSGGRYYLLPMLDMWSDVFASPGWRTTGTQAANYAIVPAGWTGAIPVEFTRIDSPTSYSWVIGRTRTDGPSDYDAVHKFQAGLKITPLSQWGKPPEAMAFKIDPSVDMKTPPKTQIDTMRADKYFPYVADLLKLQQPHLTDQAAGARMKQIGIEVGKSFDFDKLDPEVKKGLESSPEDGQKLMAWKVATLARVSNGWSMNTDTMGVYGNYYLKRAIVAQLGLGANQPEDAIYPLNLGDSDGKPLDGGSKYSIHFDKGMTPPVSGFWSITLYDSEGFQVPNSSNRFALRTRTGRSICISRMRIRAKGEEANWLPAPKGAFNLTMRIYAPKSDALTGRWNPPPIVRAQSVNALGAQ